MEMEMGFSLSPYYVFIGIVVDNIEWEFHLHIDH